MVKEAGSESLTKFTEANKMKDAAILEHISSSGKIRSGLENILEGIKNQCLIENDGKIDPDIDPNSLGSMRHMMLTNIKKLNTALGDFKNG